MEGPGRRIKERHERRLGQEPIVGPRPRGDKVRSKHIVHEREDRISISSGVAPEPDPVDRRENDQPAEAERKRLPQRRSFADCASGGDRRRHANEQRRLGELEADRQTRETADAKHGPDRIALSLLETEPSRKRDQNRQAWNKVQFRGRQRRQSRSAGQSEDGRRRAGEIGPDEGRPRERTRDNKYRRRRDRIRNRQKDVDELRVVVQSGEDGVVNRVQTIKEARLQLGRRDIERPPVMERRKSIVEVIVLEIVGSVCRQRRGRDCKSDSEANPPKIRAIHNLDEADHRAIFGTLTRPPDFSDHSAPAPIVAP